MKAIKFITAIVLFALVINIDVSAQSKKDCKEEIKIMKERYKAELKRSETKHKSVNAKGYKDDKKKLDLNLGRRISAMQKDCNEYFKGKGGNGKGKGNVNKPGKGGKGKANSGKPGTVKNNSNKPDKDKGRAVTQKPKPGKGTAKDPSKGTVKGKGKTGTQKSDKVVIKDPKSNKPGTKDPEALKKKEAEEKSWWGSFKSYFGWE